MADRLGAIKFWSEYSNTTTIVNSARVQALDLRLQQHEESYSLERDGYHWVFWSSTPRLPKHYTKLQVLWLCSPGKPYILPTRVAGKEVRTAPNYHPYRQ